MEKILNAGGWFMTNEEHDQLVEICKVMTNLLGRIDLDDSGTERVTEIGKQQETRPWKNPADWTWRPWQAPWYGPGEPVPTEWTYTVGDGEWWKHQPKTTENNNTITNNACHDNIRKL